MPPKKATTTSGAMGPGGTDGTGRSTATGAGIGVDVEPDPSTTVPEPTETAGTATGKREATVESFEALGFIKVIAKIIWLCDFPEGLKHGDVHQATELDEVVSCNNNWYR